MGCYSLGGEGDGGISLNIQAVWSRPLALKLVNSGAIYQCPEIDSIPYEPGCYIFGRAFDDYAAPLYIGKALMLRKRIEQKLDSVKLMMGIREAQRGGRFTSLAHQRSNQDKEPLR